LFENSTSARPGSQSTWGATYNLGSAHGSTNSTAAASCNFTAQPNEVVLWGSPSRNITGINATSAVLTWNASVKGIGEALYREAYGSWEVAQAQYFYLNGTNQYRAELRGLTPWGFYTAIVSVTKQAVGSSCVFYQANDTWTFVTAAKFSLSEEDLPYDSISGSGGGAIITWTIPEAFSTHATYKSGFATYVPIDEPSNITLVSLSGLAPGGSAYWYGLNLRGLPIDQNISITIETNYSYAGTTIHGTSFPFSFWYERDSSGDGLTDWEKDRGWEVTTTKLQGSVVSRWVSANPNVWATNGLVGDLIEKRYGLNPQTLDSAGSHMLDTWNMTFTLPNSSCPIRIECWYENGSNPFSFSPSPGYKAPTGDEPVVTNSTSSTHTATGGLQDDSVYDAEVLWTGGALGVLQSLIAQEGVGWVRGVVMKYDGSWTLTVSGKLSWGENPLTTSTLDDGIADGNLSNPIMQEVLQLNITNWWADLHSSNDAGAVFVEVTNASNNITQPHQLYYAGYGPSKKGSNVSASTQYQLSIPIVDPAQFVYFNVSIGDNASANGHTWYQPYAESPRSWSVDLLGQTGYSHHKFSQVNASMNVTWHIARVSEAATTYPAMPTNNTTLSAAPWGLKRYTAEPAFDLIVLNLSAAAGVDAVAGAEGGWRYDVNLSAGLDNLLVPRGMFLASPLGQALINNTKESPAVPSGSPLTFHAADWSGRTETSGTNSVPTHSSPNTNYVWIYSTAAQSQNGSSSGTFGRLPQDFAAESGEESLQVQGVYWVNVSTSGYGGLTSAAAEIADLLGGIAANSSGNITNNILNVTSELGTLGIPENVVSALANTSLANSGSYVPPEYQNSTTSSNGWTTFGSTVWNAVSGVAAETGLSRFASAVWNGLIAATVYLERAATWLLNHLGITALVNQFAGTLRTLASAMAYALNQLLTNVIIPAIKATLGAALKPLIDIMSTYAINLNSAIDPTSSEGVWSAIGGVAFGMAFTAAIIIEAVLAIVFTMTIGGDVIPESLTGFLIGIAVTSAMAIIPALTLSDMESNCYTWANGILPQSAYLADWDEWSSSLTYWETGPSVEWAATVLAIGWHQEGAVSLAVAFALAIAGLIMTWDSTAGGGPLASVSAVMLNAFSFLFAVKVQSFVQDTEILSELDRVIEVADLISVTLNAVDLAAGD
jgi:hypothetical protein